jgi:hypothetical protein
MLINIGDTVITKKKHPCGGDTWVVTRVGADVKMRCVKCDRVVMIDRVQVEKRIKKLIPCNQE